MRPSDRGRAAALEKALLAFDANVKTLHGIHDATARAVLVEQMIESIRRIEFVRLLTGNTVDPRRADPSSEIFDPIRAAIWHMKNGNYDEAFWLIFLYTHFGKHQKDGWRLVRDIYGGLGKTTWSWAVVSSNPPAFSHWLAQNEQTLKTDGISRRFGNHRKYESLSSTSQNGTAAVFASYITWVGPPRTHQDLIRDAHKVVGQNPKEVFGYLYKSMSQVKRFGRLGKFDYLTMLGKIGLAPIEPDFAYLSEATGPLSGARLLVGGSVSAKLSGKDLEDTLAHLDASLQVGMQVLEDSLCNWQKSPKHFVSFRG